MSTVRHVREKNFVGGEKVFLRLDLNLPMDGHTIVDDYRLKRSSKTLDYLRNKKVKTLIVSHTENTEKTLRPVYEHMKNFWSVLFAENLKDAKAKLDSINPGEFVLLENIRNDEGEIKNSDEFADDLSAGMTVYVNDAFSVSHRDHASISKVAKRLDSYGGFLFMEEIEALSVALSPEPESLFILGGAKFSTKLPLLEKILKLYGKVFVGGALANHMLHAQGYSFDTSRYGENLPDITSIARHQNLRLPIDVVCRSGEEKAVEDVLKTDEVVDCGKRTIELLDQLLGGANFVVWNGPLGLYEDGFSKGTQSLINVMAHRNSKSIVGGGDTVYLINKNHQSQSFGFISTAGGAMLDFLSNGTLPGIEALKKN
jgi:phosphoglycerate kinase